MASPDEAKIQRIMFTSDVTERIHQVLCLVNIVVESHDPALVVKSIDQLHVFSNSCNRKRFQQQQQPKDFLCVCTLYNSCCKMKGYTFVITLDKIESK